MVNLPQSYQRPVQEIKRRNDQVSGDGVGGSAGGGGGGGGGGHFMYRPL